MVYGLVSLVAKTCCIFCYLKSVEISPGFSVSVTIAVKFGFTLIFSLTLSRTFGKNCFVMAAFVQFSHSFCHFCVASSISLHNVLFGILLKETVVSLLHAAAFASLSASSFP